VGREAVAAVGRGVVGPVVSVASLPLPTISIYDVLI